LLELRHPDPAVARLDELRLDALHPDYGAGDLDDHRRALALARDGERDARVWLAAHALDRVAEGHALHRRVVELDDQVAGLDAGAERRRVLARRDDLDEAILHADLDAEAADLALRADLQLLDRLRVEVGRVRVEAREHAVDRLGDEALVLDRLDVVALDRPEDVRERTQLLDGQRRVRAIGDGLEVEADENTGHRAYDDESDVFHLASHVLDSRF